MIDSDDDGDRRRDKFARERRDDDSYNRRSGGGAGGYSRYDNKRPGGRRDDYQVKRSRGDEAEEDSANRGERGADSAADTDSVYAGPLLPFKKFLGNQEDDISEEDAIKKYNEYKGEHKKHQLERFFRAHKDEEWFRLKYKPEDAKKQRDALLENVQKRLQVFNEMKEQGQFDKFSLDFGDAEAIIRMLDSVVVKLENGTEDELKAVLAQKLDDESLADVKKDTNGAAEKVEEEIKEEVVPKEELEEGAIEDGSEKSSSKVNIHKTCSVFLRNIPPGLTYEELEALCKRSPGFLRLALTDGISERRFYRRGWATYKRDVNIKEICWALNAHRLRETDLNAIINRDITRRVRTNNGIAAHKQCAINDLKLAVKLTSLYDKKVGLFNAADESEADREKDIRMGVDLVATSTNPLLKEVKALVPNDVLNDISEEEAELLGMSNGGEAQAEKVRFEKDETILKALDLLIIYLRIVHSIDFYNHGHYAQEDSMPNRCGLIHVRGQPPSGATITTDEDGTLIVPQKFVNDFISGFNTRIDKGLIEKQYVSEEEMEKMGKKDGDKEVEALILKNTVELAKDKWLCPLSGKKFKGPEFIRKHLQSKHEDKLEEAKAEADFFNNYLADAQRPVDFEPKQVPRDDHRGGGDRGGGGGYGRERDDERPGRSSFGNGGGYERRQFPPRHSLGGRGGRYFDDAPRRQPVSYRDLDAPDDIP